MNDLILINNLFAKKYRLALREMYLLSYLADKQTKTFNFTDIENKKFFEFSYGEIIKNLPLLPRKIDSIYRIIKKLEDCGHIETYWDNKESNKHYMRILANPLEIIGMVH